MNYKRKYDKRRGSFCKMCKLGKRMGNTSISKTWQRVKIEDKARREMWTI